MAVSTILEELELKAHSLELGEVELEQEIGQEQKERLARKLAAWGFELIDDRRSRIVEQVKTVIVKAVHYSDAPPKQNLSEVIAAEVGLDYSYISNLFTEVEGTTIEQYAIAQRIERAKELLVYDELSVTEIADRLHYSSASHFGRQFRQVTGLTPGHFKRIGHLKRKPLDNV